MSDEYGNEYKGYGTDPEQDSQGGQVSQDSQVNQGNESFSGSYNFWAEQEADIEDTSAVGYGKKKKSSFGKKIAGLIGAAMVFGLVTGSVFQGVNWAANDWSQKNDTGSKGNAVTTAQSTSQASIGTTQVTDGAASQTQDVSSVVEKTMPSIVSITSTISQTYNLFGQDYSEDGQGSGSGIIVGKNDTELLVATNNHVVEGAKEISVTFIDGEVVSAEIKGTDSTADLAVVAIKLSDIKQTTLDAITIATLGNSDEVKVGQMAIAIGNALGYGQSVTVGYISAKDREVTVSDTTMVLLQTDAAINPGNSGGALLNLAGEVIGINSVKYASSDVEGMGYAIPISKATPIINELMNREKLTDEEKGYLGITGTDVAEEDSTRYNMPVGVYVYQVSEDGAAKEAGIVQGDIITEVNGTAVDTIAALQERVNSYRVGTKITITLKRNNSGTYEEKQVTATLKGSKTLDSLTSGTTSSQDPQATQAPGTEIQPQDPTQPDDGSSSDGSTDNSIGDFFNQQQ